jgi:nucleotide-binding universal stress UspA family protein
MIRRILVGLDGSPFSATATAVAIRLAERHGAQLVGIGVVDEPAIRGGEALPIGGATYKIERDQKRLEEARQKVDGFLERFAADCREGGVAWRLIDAVGTPHDRIVLEAQSCDLVVLGQQTFFHFETERRPCETLERVLKKGPRPVVAVPRVDSGGETVVIAYDGSVQATRALQLGQALGVYSSRPVHVVTVAAPGHGEDDARAAAARALEFLSAHEVNARLHFTVSNAPAHEVLLAAARELDAAIVVMGVYGQPAFREVVLGSVTKSILRSATTPLFLYH